MYMTQLITVYCPYVVAWQIVEIYIYRLAEYWIPFPPLFHKFLRHSTQAWYFYSNSLDPIQWQQIFTKYTQQQQLWSCSWEISTHAYLMFFYSHNFVLEQSHSLLVFSVIFCLRNQTWAFLSVILWKPGEAGGCGWRWQISTIYM